MRTLPMFLAVAGRRIVILGGGEQAAQKCRLALKTEAEIVVAAPELDPELAGLVARGRIRRHAGPIGPDLFDGAALVFIGTGCRGADAALARLAKAAGALVNVVDAPELCDAFTPAIVDRDPLVVAIGTEGAAPVLARQVKTRIEEMLEPKLGDLTALAGRLRTRVAERIAHSRRRAFWAWVFGGAPRATHAAGAEDAAARLIKDAIETGGAPGDDTSGLISIVGAGPGPRDLVTLRAVQRLQEADIVFHDRDVDPEVLELARRDAERVSLGAAGWPLDRTTGVMISAARRGQRIVRLIAGDAEGPIPDALAPADIRCEVIPGVAATPSGARPGLAFTS